MTFCNIPKTWWAGIIVKVASEIWELPAHVWCQRKTYFLALFLSQLGYRPLQDLSHSPWLIFKFILLKNKIISWRAEGCSAPADVVFHAGGLLSCFFSSIYLSLDLFFGALSALYIMVAGLGQLMWCSCCRGWPQRVDTEVHIKGGDEQFSPSTKRKWDLESN